jgi:hypothetical protein
MNPNFNNFGGEGSQSQPIFGPDHWAYNFVTTGTNFLITTLNMLQIIESLGLVSYLFQYLYVLTNLALRRGGDGGNGHAGPGDSLSPGETLVSSPSGVLSSASSHLTPSSRPTKTRRVMWESTREATTSLDVTALLQCCVGDLHCSLTIPSTVHVTQTGLCDVILQHAVEVSLMG